MAGKWGQKEQQFLLFKTQPYLFPEHFPLFPFFFTIYLLLYIFCIWQYFSGVYITFLLLHTFKEKKQTASRREARFSLTCILCRHLVLFLFAQLCAFCLLSFSLYCFSSVNSLSSLSLPPATTSFHSTQYSAQHLATMEINK